MCSSIGGTSSNLALAFNNYFNGTNSLYINNGFASFYNQTSGQHIWYNAPSGTAGNAITFTQAMTLTANGRLLLGDTTEGTERLQVTGTAKITGATTIGGAVSISNTLTFPSSNGINFANASNNSTASVYNGGGSGSSNLIVTSPATFSSSVTAASGIITGNLTVDTNTLFVDATNNRVGIGTVNPTAKVDIYGTGLQLGSTSYYYNTRVINDNNSGLLFGGHNSSSIGFIGGINELAFVTYGGAGWTEKMRLSAEGNLGIGASTINASAKLQIDSTTQGFLPPRMTAAQRSAISTPPEGLIVFQSDGVVGLYLYVNSAWKSLAIVN